MQFSILSVGNKNPTWVHEGVNDYLARLPQHFQAELIEVPMPKRNKGCDINAMVSKEGQTLLSKIPERAFVVALDIGGRGLDSDTLATQLQQWQQEHTHICFLVGGPDGLAVECLDRADFIWSLSNLTLPHFLVRIFIAEQLYRAHSILSNSPYHR